jgi:hypothetical protein
MATGVAYPRPGDGYQGLQSPFRAPLLAVPGARFIRDRAAVEVGEGQQLVKLAFTRVSAVEGFGAVSPDRAIAMACSAWAQVAFECEMTALRASASCWGVAPAPSVASLASIRLASCSEVSGGAGSRL